MQNRWIQVGEEVFTELQRHAEPLVDNADSVLRRILGLNPTDRRGKQLASAGPPRSTDLPGLLSRPEPGSTGRKAESLPQSAVARRRNSDRAPKGSLLPEGEYVLPLLEALVELGGSAPNSRVVELLETKLNGKLTETDRKTLSSGRVRWKNRVQFVRLGLIKEGYMAKEAPRGIWEISPAGRNRVVEESRRSQ